MGNKNNRLKDVKRAIKSGAFKVKNATINEVRKTKEMIASFLSKLPQPPIKPPLRSKNEKNGQPKETKTSNNCNQAQNSAQNRPNKSNQAKQQDNKQADNKQGNQNGNSQCSDNKNDSNQSDNKQNNNDNSDNNQGNDNKNDSNQGDERQNNNNLNGSTQERNAQDESNRDKEQSQQGNEQDSQPNGQQPQGNGQQPQWEQEGAQGEHKQNSDCDNGQSGRSAQQGSKDKNTGRQDNDNRTGSDNQQNCGSQLHNGNQQDYGNQLNNDNQLNSTNKQEIGNKFENSSQQETGSQLSGNGKQPNQITQEEFDKMKQALLDAKRKREQQNLNARETSNRDANVRETATPDNRQGQINKTPNDGGQEAKEVKQNTEQSTQTTKQGAQTTEQSPQAAVQGAQNPQGELQAISNVQNADEKEESVAYKEDKDGQVGLCATDCEDESNAQGAQETDVPQSEFGIAAASEIEDDEPVSNDAREAAQVVSVSATDEDAHEPLGEVTLLDMLDNILPNFSEEPVPFGNLNQDDEKVNDIIARNIIQKFVKMRFKSSKSQLNARQSATEKVSGVSKWDTMQVVKHKTTREYNKMLKDKYDYDYDSGKQEQIPLSIYLDLSPSMNAYIPTLTTLAMQLLKNDVRVIIGANDEAIVQINEIPPNMTKVEFIKLISSYNYTYYLSKTKNLKFERIDCNVGDYLTEKKAEKTLIFSDYDPLRAVCKLSQTKCHVYWFNFAEIRDSYLRDFKGVIREVSKPEDILKALTSFTSTNYNALTYKQTNTKSESAATQSKYDDDNDYHF